MMRNSLKSQWIRAKGFQYIFYILAALSALFIIGIVLLEARLTQVQINSVEKAELERLTIASEKELAKTSDLARYLTTRRVEPLPDHYTPEEYRSYYESVEQVKTVQAVSENITSISLLYNGQEFRVASRETPPSLGELATLGGPREDYSSAMSLFFSPEHPGRLFVRYLPAVKSVGADEVLLGLDLASMSDGVLPQDQELRRTFLMMEDGTILLSQKSSRIGRNFYELWDTGTLTGNETARAVRDKAGKSWYLSAAPVGNGLTAVSMSERAYYSGYIQKGVWLSLLFSLLFVGLVSLLTAGLLNVFFKPVRRIIETIGEPVMNLNQGDADAFTYINRNIERINRENSDLNEKVMETMNDLRKQQYIACQMQICPHFVSNTLSAINWLSIEALHSRNNPVSKSLANLSEIFRTTLDLNALVTDIRTEADMTRKYVEILHIRYGEGFHVHWDISEDVLNDFILKFSLQPLIENSASHAFAGVDGERGIRVSIRREGGDIRVEVRDNGVGIGPEKLSEIRRGMNDFDTLTSSHIGLKNINHRLKLLYGSAYGLTVDSRPGEGTVCGFRYPCRGGEFMDIS